MTVLSRQVKINQREKACLPACTFYLRHPPPLGDLFNTKQKQKTRFLQLSVVLLLYVANGLLTASPRFQPLQKLPRGEWFPSWGPDSYPSVCKPRTGRRGVGGEGHPELSNFFLIINPLLLWFLLSVFKFFLLFFLTFTFYLLCICREFIGKYVLYGINFKN